MEKQLELLIDEISNSRGFQGCVFADNHGLCLAARGKVDPGQSGVVTAITEQAMKLEPDKKEPVLVLESNNTICTVQRNETITGAIYKRV